MTATRKVIVANYTKSLVAKGRQTSLDNGIYFREGKKSGWKTYLQQDNCTKSEDAALRNLADNGFVIVKDFDGKES